MYFFNPKKASISEIEGVTAGFKKAGAQFFTVAHSDALSPIQIGSFTGSVRAMAESPDFTKSFKSFFI